MKREGGEEERKTKGSETETDDVHRCDQPDTCERCQRSHEKHRFWVDLSETKEDWASFMIICMPTMYSRGSAIEPESMKKVYEGAWESANDVKKHYEMQGIVTELGGKSLMRIFASYYSKNYLEYIQLTIYAPTIRADGTHIPTHKLSVNVARDPASSRVMVRRPETGSWRYESIEDAFRPYRVPGTPIGEKNVEPRPLIPFKDDNVVYRMTQKKDDG